MVDASVSDASVLFDAWRQRVDRGIEAALDAVIGTAVVQAAVIEASHEAASTRTQLQAAMRHAALLGGKRMRPLLVYATGTMLGANLDALDAPAVAIELIHAYSLVHDDLPAMDNDALRRGQPTVHIAFDEATAILAGDALQTLAFERLCDTPISAEARLTLVRELATASGAAGMCGGQALDIAATGHGGEITMAQLERLHALKTGALLRAAVRFGAITAGADADTRRSLDHYAEALGLAFQIRDDLLDINSDSTTLGKTAGKDAAQNKATFPALLGRDASEARLQTLSDTMQHALSSFGTTADVLRELAIRVVERNH